MALKKYNRWTHSVCCALALLVPYTSPTQAAEPLRYGVLDSMAFPMVKRNESGAISGGLLHDLGAALARELGTSLHQVPLSRKRLEGALHSDKVDLVCFLSPQWVEQPLAVHWSLGTLLQIERIVTPRGAMVAKLTSENFEGKRVATQLGYRYPGLQAWFESGAVKRVDQTRVALMFKSIEVGSSDALVTSEDEIEAFFHMQPQARARFEVSPFVVSRVSTQCAVSKVSRHALPAIDKALAALTQRGEIGRMSASYRLTSP